MKKILIIGYVWPEPNSSAAGTRIIQLILFFQSLNYHITFASPAQPTEHMADLKALNIHTENIKLNCESFDDFILTLNPDMVMFDRFMMEEQFGWRVAQQCPNAIRLLDSEDLFCLRHARHHAFKQQREITDTNLLNSYLLNADLLNSELAKREVAAIFRCDLTLMISHVEMSLLQQTFNVDKALLHYCPFMFEQQQLNQTITSYTQRQNFISIGNFRHPPNWDAVLWLKQQIWPLIRAQLPQANLLIYGAYPPPKATALHDEKTGFLVKGWVDDAQQAMQDARICLAPLRFGAGIKGKLAEAMMCGTPSVTTYIGAESMQSDNPWGGAVISPVINSVISSAINNPQQQAQAIADAAINLYEQETLWQQASENGITNAQTMYESTQHYDQLTIALDTLINNIEQHRQQNFIGSMLNHHSHQSTKYMAQWIEAKNKLPQTNL